jgi:hypothetical protein
MWIDLAGEVRDEFAALATCVDRDDTFHAFHVVRELDPGRREYKAAQERERQAGLRALGFSPEWKAKRKALEAGRREYHARKERERRAKKRAA